ncbi:SDR family NAD(P)-dependent oxidoreductase [Ruixingdingia sedimenti]|uniref:SDR family NAD(P)-dependent oxidoreductase n=1 Tax=Ruixingdingia sedimenti TaxID=3073604 RepID=A0ABU1FCT8_9RHOB|nr:SDR family NAD(P)-dependent oxidoreductase [Xinfangfangia sp. LG-4]MDR5654708.1 SDR family NAD(P)-dependent oxidoreductase [Xinfangfangia sp. LG-4]
MTQHIAPLERSTIVLCGASSGFGRGAALELGRRGARLVLMARRQAALADLAGAINAAGGQAIATAGDISRAGDVAAVAAAAVEGFGGFDIWINNVGIGALGLFWDIPVEDQARVIDVNLKGLMFGAHAAMRQFRAQGHGVLVNVGSIDSEVPIAYQTTYAATKAAVLSLGRSLNAELRLAGLGDRIRVGTVMPWAVDTPWWNHAANYTGHAPRMAAMDDPSLVVDAILRACTDPQEEMPVGPKARAANLSHRLFPDLTERLSSTVAHREVQKADPLAPTAGAIYTPSTAPADIGGGVRARMRAEDADRT